MACKRILMLVGDYVEDYEAIVPYQMMLKGIKPIAKSGGITSQSRPTSIRSIQPRTMPW